MKRFFIVLILLTFFFCNSINVCATEGTLSPVGCVSEGDYTCSMAQPCMEAYMWKGLYDVMRDYLTGITLQDIIDRESAIAADSYSI